MSINTSSTDVSTLTVQRSLAKVWTELGVGTNVAVMGTIEEAVRQIRSLAAQDGDEGVETVVLVTGSLHLVGGVLEVLETLPANA